MAQEEVSLGPALFLPIRGMEVSEKSIAYPTRKSHGQGFPDPMSFQVTHSATKSSASVSSSSGFPSFGFPKLLAGSGQGRCGRQLQTSNFLNIFLALGFLPMEV